MNTMVTLMAAEELRERHGRLLRAGLQQTRPACAARLGVTEVELIAAQCGVRAVELALRPGRLLPLLGSLGEVRVVTGNTVCRQEQVGCYQPVQVRGNVAFMTAGELDLRLFLSHWGSCHAVQEQGKDSLRWHDRTGRLVHAVHLTPGSDRDAYEALLHQHARKRWQMPSVEPVRPAAAGIVRDAEQLRRDWLAQRDAGELQLVLQRQRLSRLAALQALGPDLAQEVGACAISHVLKVVAGTRLGLQGRTVNRGVVQTRSGLLTHLQREADVLLLEAGGHAFRLDVRAIDSVWVVAVPAAEGWRLDLEVYDRAGELSAGFSGLTQDGRTDRRAWPQLLRGLCAEPLLP
ncbi:MAG: ChuX/HutX family heme-like substrate-binding protein [Perlucidibaca sp.]